MLTSFLCLLVLVTPVDDVWTRAAPQADAGTWASDNNDFLGRVGDGLAALRSQPAARAGRLGGRARSPRPAPAGPAGPDLLYLLMSLQR
jgi:hypothetical protein